MRAVFLAFCAPDVYTLVLYIDATVTVVLAWYHTYSVGFGSGFRCLAALLYALLTGLGEPPFCSVLFSVPAFDLGFRLASVVFSTNR